MRCIRLLAVIAALCAPASANAGLMHHAAPVVPVVALLTAGSGWTGASTPSTANDGASAGTVTATIVPLDASFNASIASSGGTMTVNSVASGTLVPQQVINCDGINHVIAYGLTGTGGTGNYQTGPEAYPCATSNYTATGVSLMTVSAGPTLTQGEWVNTTSGLAEVVQVLGSTTYYVNLSVTIASPNAMSIYAYGYGDPVIATIDQPPFQTTTASNPILYFTVDAWHQNGGGASDAGPVKCALDNGPFVSVSTRSTNPQTGTFGFVFAVGAGSGSDKLTNTGYPGTGGAPSLGDIRCEAHAANGQTTMLQGLPVYSDPTPSLYVNINNGGTAWTPATTYVASTGNDSNLCTAGSPCLTLQQALVQLDANEKALNPATCATANTCAGGGTIRPVTGDTGSYSWGNAVSNTIHTAASQWINVDFTLAPSAAVTSNGGSTGLRSTKIRARNIAFNYAAGGDPTIPSGNYATIASQNLNSEVANGGISSVGQFWFDNSPYTAIGEGYGTTQIIAGDVAGDATYLTGVTTSGAVNGCVGHQMCRNVSVTNNSADAFSNSHIVINSSTVNQGDPFYGGDQYGTTLTGTLTSGSDCITALASTSSFNFGETVIVGTALGPYFNTTPIVLGVGTGDCSAGQVQLGTTAGGAIMALQTGSGLTFSHGQHADVYQFQNPTTTGYTNIMIDGLVATNRVFAQGLFESEQVALVSNVAVVNSTFNNQNPPAALVSMQFLSPTKNMMWTNNVWGKAAMSFRWDQGFNALDFLIQGDNCGQAIATSPSSTFNLITLRGTSGC